MCFRLNQCTEHTPCGHTTVARQHRIDCNKSTCRISASHNSGRHDCARDCVQNMLPDQSVIMETSSMPCNLCRGRTNGH
ncbi:hypothetical protein SCLCIDRAFT_139613 [Scleroderma citrinum Foug A]|uniref:Uncharacterized protein n=1 Tax=Scleroderma citrinum Foug A TaxID=1036808 RepID=A0A0C3D9S4_9AGAM|nr:hypothetical protein SCLCIDRAFT_139613 [Scleroderma citrinum Foug A]